MSYEASSGFSTQGGLTPTVEHHVNPRMLGDAWVYLRLLAPGEPASVAAFELAMTEETAVAVYRVMRAWALEHNVDDDDLEAVGPDDPGPVPAVV